MSCLFRYRVFAILHVAAVLEAVVYLPIAYRALRDFSNIPDRETLFTYLLNHNPKPPKATNSTLSLDLSASPPWHRQIALAISPSQHPQPNPPTHPHSTAPNTHQQQNLSERQTSASAASNSSGSPRPNQTQNGSSRRISTCHKTTAANQTSDARRRPSY